MLTTAPSPLRSALLSTRLPAIYRTPSNAPFSTLVTLKTHLTPSPANHSQRSRPSPRPSQPHPLRSASTTSRTPDPTLSYAASVTASPQRPSTAITWNDFLALRRTRRRYNLVASLSTSLCTTAAGLSALAQQNIENVGVFGLDPVIVLGMATAGSGAVGWLLGPFVGNAVFGGVYRGLRGEIVEKERDLYRRIKKHRVDPSSSSAGNPVPDYYGEKIGSVKEYRTWMKDQRAYNKRRQNFL